MLLGTHGPDNTVIEKTFVFQKSSTQDIKTLEEHIIHQSKNVKIVVRLRGKDEREGDGGEWREAKRLAVPVRA